MTCELPTDRLQSPATLPLAAGLLLTVVAVVRFTSAAYGGATVAALSATVCFGFAVVID